jgi:hypothetical protein
MCYQTHTKRLFEKGSSKGMKRKWLLGIMALLTMALLAPPTSAATISLDSNVNYFTMSKGQPGGAVNLAPTNADTTSTVAASGTAYYTNPNLTGTDSLTITTSTGSTAQINYSDAWLTAIQGQIYSNTNTTGHHTLSANLSGVGPHGSISTPGYITETVTDTFNYTVTVPSGNAAVVFSIPYTWSYSLNNSVADYIYRATYNVTVSFYIDGGTTPIATFSPVNITYGSDASKNVPLSDISQIGSGALSSPSGFKPSAGSHTFSVVLTETVTGYSEPGYSAPIPPSAFLLGSGLLGLGLMGWRRKRA